MSIEKKEKKKFFKGERTASTIIIIIGIACCESAIDLCDLRDGNQVPLYKSAETWHCSITGLTNAAKGKAGEIIKEVTGTAISEGVNQLNSFLDMSDEQLAEAIKGGTNQIEQAVTNAYDQVITENAPSPPVSCS